MKKLVISGFLLLNLAVIPSSFANDVSVMDHDGDGQYYEISRSAYALADAGERMAYVCYRGGSLAYAANNLHMAASRLYHLTSGNPGLNEIGVMDHDDPSLPSNIHYAVEAVEQSYQRLDYEYRRYSQVDYRTQQAFYAVYNRYQALMNTIPNR